MRVKSFFIMVLAAALSVLSIGCQMTQKVSETKTPSPSDTAKQESKPQAAVSHFEGVKPDYTFKFSLQEPATDNPEYNAAKAFKDYVESHTNGKIRIDLYPGAQLGKEKEIFQAVKAGNVDMGTAADGPLGSFVPETTVLAIPYLFKSAPIAWEVLNGSFGQELKNLILQKTGVNIIGLSQNGFRSFTNSKHPIHKLEDLQGLKIRVMENQLYIKMVNALGAHGVPMAGGDELYSALQQHVVDGQENPLDGIWSYKLYEPQPYITVDNHTFSSKFLFMNDKLLSSLPVDYRDIVKEAGSVWTTQLEGPKEQASVDAFYLLKQKVKEIYPLPASEQKRFKEKAQPAVIDWMKTQIDPVWIDKVQKAASDAEKKLYGTN
ncbi:TRAP transporter substrate-binding protein [Ferviditalea candida]|uniref:TRAP transporter substrate-binding protein n=1 Tax=Ferviditalea candida TaxID=3108399 RepID=A0ABU5ZJI0_9BACL|nr:TRAP transporter substrate-binding protein [Paenibacillaceae bacterium T2]